MSKIAFLRSTLSLSLAMLFIVLSYELNIAARFFPAYPDLDVVIAVVLIFLGPRVSGKIVGFILSIPKIRRKVAGKEYVEGYWILKTPKGDGADSILNIDGLACIRYDDQRDRFRVETTRYKDDGQRVETLSVLARIEGPNTDLRYLNCFRYSGDGAKDPLGLSHGSFAIGDDKHPNFLSAKIGVFGGVDVYTQTGEPVEPKTIKNLREKHGKDWKKHLLLRNEDVDEDVH